VQRRLNSRELCDCGRDENAMVENHYYYNPDSGIRVSFLWRPGTGSMQAHDLQWLGERCMQNAFKRRRAAMNAGVWGGGRSATCRQKGCRAGACQKARPIHKLDEWEGMRAAVRRLEPDVLVINVGLWTASYTKPGAIERLRALGRELRRRNPALQLIWKTTTPHDPTQVRSEKSTNGPMMAALKNDPDWRLSDAGGAAKHIQQLARRHGPGNFYRDAAHFQPWVYRGFNELLLADLCSVHNDWLSRE